MPQHTDFMQTHYMLEQGTEDSFVRPHFQVELPLEDRCAEHLKQTYGITADPAELALFTQTGKIEKMGDSLVMHGDAHNIVDLLQNDYGINENADLFELLTPPSSHLGKIASGDVPLKYVQILPSTLEGSAEAYGNMLEAYGRDTMFTLPLKREGTQDDQYRFVAHAAYLLDEGFVMAPMRTTAETQTQIASFLHSDYLGSEKSNASVDIELGAGMQIADTAARLMRKGYTVVGGEGKTLYLKHDDYANPLGLTRK